MDNGEGESDVQLEPDPSQVKRVKSNEDFALTDELQIQPFQRQKCWLPLEMWDNVLGDLDDPKDIIFCSDVCYNWNSLLQPKMTSAYFELILPKLVPYLGAKDLLSSSAVSKAWNHRIDCSVMDFKRNSSTTFWTSNTHIRLPHICFVEDEDEGDIEPFLAEKEVFADNQFDSPLAYRHVVVIQDSNNWNIDNEAFEVFYQRLLRFLQRFGKYIYQLEVRTNGRLLQKIRIITICLSNSPNLESFLWAAGNRGEANNDDAQQVDDFLAVSPLPNSNFKKLHLDYAPSKLVKVLVERYGNQLEFVHNFRRVNVPGLVFRGVTFQNIKVFRSKVHGDTVAANETYELDYITEMFRRLKWTLTEVDLIFVGQFDYCALYFDNFFQALQEHQPQIHTLRLSLLARQRRGCIYSFAVLNLRSMKMPNLKRLTLDQVGIPPVGFFQIATPGLEYLIIYNRVNYKWIRPNEKLNEMWMALPKCKMIRSSNFNENRPLRLDARIEPITYNFTRN